MKGKVKYGILRIVFQNSKPIFTKVLIKLGSVTLVDEKGNTYGHPFPCDIDDIIFVTTNFKDMENLHLLKEAKTGYKIGDLYVHYEMDSGFLVSKTEVKTGLFLIDKNDSRLKVSGSDHDIDKKEGN